MLRRTLVALQEATRASSSSNFLTSHLARSSLPPVLARAQMPHKSLYQLLSSLPNDGVGYKVRQRRWAAKGLDVPADVNIKDHVTALRQNGQHTVTKDEDHLCYWEVTKVKLKDGGNHGKAWGRLIWRGKTVIGEDTPKRITGGLKYFWESAR